MATDNSLFDEIRRVTALDMAGVLRPSEKLRDARRSGAHPKFIERLAKLSRPKSLLLED